MVRPVYQQIADQLRGMIESGELPPGAQLPTQDQLVEQYKAPGAEPYQASRGSIRRALEDLVHEGLVVSRRPAGVFVRDRKRIVVRPQAEFGRRPSPLMDMFMGLIAEQGGEPSQTIDVAMVRPPKAVAERLRTDDEVVVVRQRVRSVDGERYNLNDSYYPRRIVEGSEVLLPDDIARGVNTVLAELGHEQILAIKEYICRMPTPRESQRLELGPGTPVLEELTTGYVGDSEDSEPVRCVVTIMPGDRHRVVYEVRKPGAEPSA